MKQLLDLVRKETNRQTQQVNLIASENFAPQPILKLLSSALSNKYAEGYKSNRYYAGTENVAQIEQIAIDTAQKVFKTTMAVNVQSLSGSPANLAVYNAFLSPGDGILSLKLNSGGHLSHGATTSIVSKLYKIHHYGLDTETEEINLEEIDNILSSGKVKMLIVGFSSYCRDIDYVALRQICDKHNVHLHVDFSHTAGLVAAGLMNNPLTQADSAMCTTHKTLRGPRGAIIFSRDGSKVDKSVFPGVQGGPHMNNIAAIAATLIGVDEEYVQYQKQVIQNRLALEKCFSKQNLFQGGSDNHMIIVKNLTDGSLAQKALEDMGIVTNRQMLPGDKKVPSGIRMGTPFVTSQGYDVAKMEQVGIVVKSVLDGFAK